MFRNMWCAAALAAAMLPAQAQDVKQLERRVQELEQRVAEMRRSRALTRSIRTFP